MKLLVIVLLLFIILFYSQSNAQSVLVSEYFNDQPIYEWNELLVVTDNLDMRGFVVTDNNTAQVTRQGGVRFKNIDFWRHVRAGTIIGIWHRDYPTNAKADRDTSMADGRIMLAKNDTMFFEAYKSNDAIVNDAPFNIAIDGDIIEVLDAAGNHIHALGHRIVDPAPGTYYVNMATPKMNVATSLLNGQSNRFFPGSKLEDYNGNQGDTIAKVCIENMTRTLPNKDCWTDSSNSDFWHFLRSPRWASPTLNAIVKPNNVELNWNTLSDSYPDDNMQGYLLIRDSGNVSTLPVNGTTYITGQRIGSSIVIANLPTSQTTFIDTLAVVSGTKYSYRVYAYRFGIDDELGNGANPNTSRGRQYNTT
ncbi:MAG: hypothetical protein JNJ85_08055, partial [Candidatus Kapabacteria bacterium]|nr:hypothetical protein [Candidatus Kapabacteria bacterium]